MSWPAPIGKPHVDGVGTAHVYLNIPRDYFPEIGEFLWQSIRVNDDILSDPRLPTTLAKYGM